MKISYLFLIVAGVIALGAVTAALEIEVVKRDIAAPEGKVDIETTLKLGGSKNTLRIEIVKRDICLHNETLPNNKRPLLLQCLYTSLLFSSSPSSSSSSSPSIVTR